MGTQEKIDARRTDGRDVLLAAAVRCMVRHGYHGTSIRQIAAEAGMTSAALYHHFDSKQAILVEIMREALDEAHGHTVEATAAETTARAQLHAMTSAWVHFHCVKQGHALIGSSEIRSLDSVHRPHIIALRDRQEDLFRDVVSRGVASGEFTTDKPNTAARAILSMGRTVSEWFDPRGPQNASSVAAEYADLAVAMVR